MKKLYDNHVTITCASFVPLLSICMALNDWKKRLQNCSIYSSKKRDGLRPNQFQRVHMNDIPTVEDLLPLSILLYDIDIVAGNIVRALAGPSVQKSEKTVCDNYDTTTTYAT